MPGVLRVSKIVIINYRRRARKDTKLDKYVKSYQQACGFAEDISCIDTLRPTQNGRIFQTTFWNTFPEGKCVNFD